MGTLNEELDLVLDQVDEWFTDLTLDQPVKPLSRPKVDPKKDSQTQTNDDNDKLAIICRTTSDWFQMLEDPLMRDDTLQVDYDDTSDVGLDILVENLESLLDDRITQEDFKSRNELQKPLSKTISDVEAEVIYFRYHPHDSTMLLDDSIGCCCTITKDNSDNKAAACEEFSVVISAFDEFDELKSNTTGSQDVVVVTTTPTDHDYLARCRFKPLSMSNKLIQSSRGKSKQSSVLNTEALKRFARFSNEFRQLSMKQSKLLVVNRGT